MKTCKQCGRTLELECFKQYPPRGAGLRTTVQGRHTICKECEATDVIARKLLTDKTDPRYDIIVNHYTKLKERGFPPVTKSAATLIGYAHLDKVMGVKLPGVVMAMINEDMLEHADKVRNRLYDTFDIADAVHKTMAEKLRSAGLYEEINDLMDVWFDEED